MDSRSVRRSSLALYPITSYRAVPCSATGNEVQEAVESLDPAHPLTEAFHSCFRARIEFLSATNVMDLRYGRVLPVHMEALGLIELGNEAVTLVDHGASQLSRLWVQTWQLTDDAIIAKGDLAESEVVDARRALEDPAFIYRGALMQSVWGRRTTVLA